MTDVRTLVDRGDVDAVARAMIALDDAGRKVTAAGLPELVRGKGFWWSPEATALAVVTVGCAPSAAIHACGASLPTGRIPCGPRI